VFQSLAKTYTRDAGTATEVLAHRAGDCTEHSLLLITLYRAAGLPARPLSGLGYDSGNMMAHHAWVEVYFDGGWLPVDPSFDQVPADAGHVLFDRDEGLSGFSVAGSLKLEVVAYEGPSGSYSRPPDLRLLGVGLFALFLLPLLGGPVALALWVHFTQD
ncbi:MAG: transglutaminase domain-containing protein, partial [Candidatus Eremiobacteraeota bacterium]|nr:transglutaminase domain-containing protein [Candidatus Eremiobacteraeota bacterium]